MSESSTLIQWLLFGGLVVIAAGLGSALYLLRIALRKLAAQSETLGRLLRSDAEATRSLAKLAAAPDLPSVLPDVLREEWQTFTAIYRADWATAVAEARLSKAQESREPASEAPDALERAILMAQAGRNAQAIMAECGLARWDAEAMVHFHQPRLALAG